MAEQKEKFLEGAIKNNISKKWAEKSLKPLISLPIMVSIRATQLHTQLLLTKPYLKAHYLEEFLAANLSNEYGNTDKVTNLLEDCRKLNVKVLPPDINNPTVKFGVKKKKIIFGMSD